MIKKEKSLMGLALLLLTCFVSYLFLFNNHTNYINAQDNSVSTSNVLDSRQFIKETEILNSNNQSQETFGPYDTIHAVWHLNFPKGQAKSGDHINIAIPSIFKLPSNVAFDITDNNSKTTIAHVFASSDNQQMVITLTDNFDTLHDDFSATINLSVNWHLDTTKENIIDSSTFGNSSIKVEKDDGPGKDELITKWSWYNNNDQTVHWRVRLNYAKKQISDAVYTDDIGLNQKLIRESLHVYKVNYDKQGMNFTEISDSNFHFKIHDVTDSSFAVNLGNINQTVLIDYSTAITDNKTSLQYTNHGNLTGKEIDNQPVDALSPVISGSGSGDSNTSINGQKIWDDNNQTNQRPKTITVNLLDDNNQIVSSKQVDATNNWQFSFLNLPKYKDGQTIHYKLMENTVQGYQTTIDQTNYTITNHLINQPITDKISLSIQKKWQNDNQPIPNQVKLQLFNDNQAVGTPITLSKTNDWQTTLTNLPKGTYTVKELDTPENYKTEIDYSNKNHIVITNILQQMPTQPTSPISPTNPTSPTDSSNPSTPVQPNSTQKTITVAGEKIWHDQDNHYQKRPQSIMVNLYADGVKVFSQSVSDKTSWHYEFNNLPQFKNNQIINYTINEDSVDNYKTTINHYDIINTINITNSSSQPSITTPVQNQNNHTDTKSTNTIKPGKENLPQTGENKFLSTLLTISGFLILIGFIYLLKMITIQSKKK